MDPAAPNLMEATFDNRLGLLSSDDDFDPVLEIRRLRQDLMRRIQRLQQSAVAEPEEKAVSVEESTVVSKSETIIYVSPIFRDSSPIVPEPSESSAFQTVPPTLERQTAVVDAPQIVLPEEESVAIVSDPHEPATESWFARFLGQLNTILVLLGFFGALGGLRYLVFKDSLDDPQRLALRLLIVGAALVFVGVVGRVLHWRVNRVAA